MLGDTLDDEIEAALAEGWPGDKPMKKRTSKAFVKPSEWKRAGDGKAVLDPDAIGLVKGRGGFRPRKKAITREEHRTALLNGSIHFYAPPISVNEAQAFLPVIEELARTKDRVLPTDPLRRCALVVEEAGEALKEVLDETRAASPVAEFVIRERVRTELVQCAAMAIRVLGAMDEEDRSKKQRVTKGPYRRRTTKV